MSLACCKYQLGLKYIVYDNRELWSKDKSHITCVFSYTSQSEASFNVYSENLKLTLCKPGFFYLSSVGRSRGGGRVIVPPL